MNLITRSRDCPRRDVAPRGSELFSDTQVGDDSFVSVYALGFQIIQEPSALTHKLKKTSTGMMVLLVNFKMFGQVSDPLAEKRYLDLR